MKMIQDLMMMSTWVVSRSVQRLENRTEVYLGLIQDLTHRNKVDLTMMKKLMMRLMSQQEASIHFPSSTLYNVADLSTSIADQPPPKKPYEITYKIRSIQDLQEEQKELIDRVAGLIDTDVSEFNTRSWR
jgi:hypothetical protein